MAGRLFALTSTIGKKVFIGFTGLILFFFLVAHLAGNLLLFVSADAFNAYSHKLISLGWMLYVAEAFLLLAFLVHIGFAVATAIKNRTARKSRYAAYESQGQPSKLTLSSRTMIWTGLVILVFTVLHIITFKYGPDIEDGYVTIIEEEPMRDLAQLVYETFSNELYVIWYVAAMAFMGFHLRHGFWSAFQSLGAHHPRYTPVIYAVGVVSAIVLAIGFLAIPVWIYFTGA